MFNALCCVACCLGLVIANAMADPMLFNFDVGFDFAKVEARDVKVSEVKREGGSALRMATFHHQEWPGITLPAPEGRWDLSGFETVALDVRNVGSNAVTVCCRVDNPGADGVFNCNTGSIALKPGEQGTLQVRLVRRPPGPPVKLFGMRGYPEEARSTKGTVDATNITQLVIFVPRPQEDHVFEIDNVRATGEHAVGAGPSGPLTPFYPFIDTFGQYMHKDWPGKTHSLEELADRLKAERRDLEQWPGPSDWDQYGGWAAGPTLEATGFFRTAKHAGKWWLVDPDGKLFFSHGIDCVRASEYTPIEERETWFADFPGDQPEFREFVAAGMRTLHGHYAGRAPKCFSFHCANLKRKYGEEWREKCAEMAHRRLRSWGLNTIGNWSDPAIYVKRRTPYVVAVHFGGKLLEGSSGYWSKFRDVFDPDFQRQLRQRMAAEVGSTAGDPWCIGYFVDNELSWGDEVSLAMAALASPPEQVAKQVFVEDLKAKYKTVEALNAKWGTSHESWEALLQSRELPDKARAREDLVAFNRKTAERYFRICREAVKEVAPNNLYLGCRFAWVNAQVAEVAAQFCDVVSLNLYRRSVADFQLPGLGDVPLIIGEFHFGALDRGMFHTGLVPVSSQEERAEAYKEYVEGCLRHPNFVGCHWFQYVDQPTTGRYLDEENYQIGFVDVADTPYRETIEACREVGYRMYRLRAGDPP